MVTLYDIDQLNATIAEQAATIERQRVEIETLLEAIKQYLVDDNSDKLIDAYLAVSSASTMTGGIKNENGQG